MDGAEDNGPSPALDLHTTELFAASTFLKPNGPPPTMPWEMAYEERRRHSKDPRVMKQLAEEDQWKGTSCSAIWKKLRVFALPKNDWIFTSDLFLQFLTVNSVKGTQFMAKVLQVFDPSASGLINGLVVCKQLHLALTTQPLCERIAHHCFERFDRLIGDDHISLKYLKKCKLMTPHEIAARSQRKGGKKGGSTGGISGGGQVRETMVSGARYDNVEGLKRLMMGASSSQSSSAVLSPTSEHNDDEDARDENKLLEREVEDQEIPFSLFLGFFLDERNGDWIGSFIVPILECCVKYCIPPAGTLPLIPLRWLRSIEPLPATNAMYDSDVMMLREIELTGIDPTQQSKDKKKKKGGKKK